MVLVRYCVETYRYLFEVIFHPTQAFGVDGLSSRFRLRPDRSMGLANLIRPWAEVWLIPSWKACGIEYNRFFRATRSDNFHWPSVATRAKWIRPSGSKCICTFLWSRRAPEHLLTLPMSVTAYHQGLRNRFRRGKLHSTYIFYIHLRGWNAASLSNCHYLVPDFTQIHQIEYHPA